MCFMSSYTYIHAHTYTHTVANIFPVSFLYLHWLRYRSSDHFPPIILFLSGNFCKSRDPILIVSLLKEEKLLRCRKKENISRIH